MEITKQVKLSFSVILVMRSGSDQAQQANNLVSVWLLFQSSHPPRFLWARRILDFTIHVAGGNPGIVTAHTINPKQVWKIQTWFNNGNASITQVPKHKEGLSFYVPIVETTGCDDKSLTEGTRWSMQSPAHPPVHRCQQHKQETPINPAHCEKPCAGQCMTPGHSPPRITDVIISNSSIFLISSSPTESMRFIRSPSVDGLFFLPGGFS